MGTKPKKVRLQAFLAQDTVRLVFPRPEKPKASIVIPTFDKAAFLYQCLESLLAHTDGSYEVIIVDDASRDGTRRLLDKIDGAWVILNDENLGFIRSCNRGAAFARGPSILFLNNDVTVTPAWLSRLLEPLDVDPTCGGVGAKLVRPDGSLQEAGSVVWQDATAAGYGRDDHPFKPDYSYRREVDYCSAACLLVRADLFRALGGFDERYLPAYYEDADLCFGIRRLGRTVVFQPEVVVFHHEYGSGSSAQAKTHCRANAPKFAAKWAEELARQRAPGDLLRGRDRRPGPRVLLIDDRVPAPRLGLGLPRTHRLLEFMSDLGCVVTFVPAVDMTPHQPTTSELQRWGVEVFFGDGFRPEDVVIGRQGFYETVIVSRPHNAKRLLALARRYNPNALVVYDAEALFCAREFLKAALEGRPLDEATKRAMLKRELRLTRHADIVMTVSERDRSIVIEKGGHRQVAVWGHALDAHMPSTGFSRRNDLLFVGTLTTGHAPNIDAVVHFATKVLPRIRARIPECRLLVVGGDPTEPVRRLASDSVHIIGYAEDLRPYYDACRVFVVPNRYGAGISLKLLEAMAHGLPAVISAFSATGLDLRDGEQVLIADNDEVFAEKVVSLYEDESLWLALQEASLDCIRSRYSSQIMRDKLAAILNLRVAAPAR
jgi:GT2 family glycosyltransferase/glycosyltransferase involved in cell wall biosynthesis